MFTLSQHKLEQAERALALATKELKEIVAATRDYHTLQYAKGVLKAIQELK